MLRHLLADPTARPVSLDAIGAALFPDVPVARTRTQVRSAVSILIDGGFIRGVAPPTGTTRVNDLVYSVPNKGFFRDQCQHYFDPVRCQELVFRALAACNGMKIVRSAAWVAAEMLYREFCPGEDLTSVILEELVAAGRVARVEGDLQDNNGRFWVGYLIKEVEACPMEV